MMNLFAASGSKKVTASGKMSVALNVGQTEDSSSVSINVSGLPSNAVITKLEVNTGTLTFQGAVASNYLTISSSNRRTEQIKWGGAIVGGNVLKIGVLMYLIFISTLIKRSVLGLNINSFTNKLYNNTGLNNSKYVETYFEKSKKTSSKDTLAISLEAYEAQLESKELSATSGKDTLGITSGSDNNTFVIHFYDSAMVSRAISRGYITVNGTRIDLSDETKQQLAEVDKQAEADRMMAFNEYVMQHDIAVAKQQSESWQKAYKDASKALKIAAKVSRGGKVTNEEAKILMDFNPQLYAMAMTSASSTKQNNHQESMQQTEIKNKDESTSGVEWSQFEWKTYESQMTVSLGKSVGIQRIFEGENIINEGTN